jgi:hypothetical protein
MTTQQATPPKDMNRNPEGKGGFADNPQNRNPGGWDKTQSISYQYNRLMRMNPAELEAFVPETVAQEIALVRLQAARDIKFGLPDTKEITDRVEGKAPQSIDVTTGGDKLNVALVEFVHSGSSQDSNKDS